MKSWKKAILIGTCLCVSLVFIMFLFLHFSSRIVIVNKLVDISVVSAKDMISISKEQIENTFDVKNLYVGNITMYLDEKHRGEVIITFADEKEDLVRYLARFNTAEHVFNNIEYCSNGSKLDSAPISVDEWKIDSTEAIAISANAFAEEDNFKYDKVYVTSSMRFYDSKEFWNVHFTNSNMKIVYDVRIDVYTGDIASKLIRHIR